MSISSMADGAIQRKLAEAGASTQVTPRPSAGTVTPAAAPTATPRTITPLKGASDVARYVPTEAIGLYIAILVGAFGPLSVPADKTLDQLDFSNRWHFYFVMLGVTAALVWLIYAAKTRETPAKAAGKKFNIPVFEMAVAVVAMAAWAAALPESPFADYHWYGGWFSAIVLSTTITLLPLIAAALGKLPPTYEQQTQ